MVVYCRVCVTDKNLVIDKPFMIFNNGNASVDLDQSLLEESDEDVDFLCQ